MFNMKLEEKSYKLSFKALPVKIPPGLKLLKMKQKRFNYNKNMQYYYHKKKFEFVCYFKTYFRTNRVSWIMEKDYKNEFPVKQH